MDDLIRKKCNRIQSSLRGPRECADKEKVGHPYPVRKSWVSKKMEESTPRKHRHACGYERETARHTTVFCPRYRATRNQLLIDDRLDFKRLLTGKEGVSKLTRWWII